MVRRVAPDTVAAAARFLAVHPSASNLDLIRYLTATLGEASVRGVAINRVRKLIREPALQWLRDNEGKGARAPGVPAQATPDAPQPAPDRPAPEPSRPRPAPNEARRSARRPASDHGPAPVAPSPPGSARPAPAVTKSIDEALVEAFTLGTESDTAGDIARTWGQVDDLRRQIRALLAG